MRKTNLLGVFISKAFGTVETRISPKSKATPTVQRSNSCEWVMDEFGFPVLASDDGQLVPSEKIYELLELN